MSLSIPLKNISRTFRSQSRTRFSVALGSIALATAAYYEERSRRNSPPHGNGNGNGNPLNKAWFGFGASAVADYEVNTREAAPAKDKAYYQGVYNEIAKKILDHDDWDDGSYGPLLVRFAWHNSGSYDQHDKTNTKGGSYGGTMRFEKEQKDPENAGLPSASKFLESIHAKYPDLSFGDLNTLGGVVAVQEMDGPKIPWRPGRLDLPEEDIPPYHRLPDAHMTTGDYVRSVFTDRLGFTDKEMVCLIGVGHGIGRCHTTSSGFDDNWTFSPTTITNSFYDLLLNGSWHFRKWDGPQQYQDDATNSLMMLPTDMVLKTDEKFRKYCEEYAKDSDLCMKDFSSAFSRLLERGISFPASTEKMEFQTLEEQGLDDE